jgi:hypothetical protein
MSNGQPSNVGVVAQAVPIEQNGLSGSIFFFFFLFVFFCAFHIMCSLRVVVGLLFVLRSWSRIAVKNLPLFFFFFFPFFFDLSYFPLSL